MDNDKARKYDFNIKDEGENWFDGIGVAEARWDEIHRIAEHCIVDYTHDLIKTKSGLMKAMLDECKPQNDTELVVVGMTFGMVMASMKQAHEQEEMKQAVLSHAHGDNPFRMQPTQKRHES
jgi:hypothetical protein